MKVYELQYMLTKYPSGADVRIVNRDLTNSEIGFVAGGETADIPVGIYVKDAGGPDSEAWICSSPGIKADGIDDEVR